MNEKYRNTSFVLLVPLRNGDRRLSICPLADNCVTPLDSD